MMFINNLSVIKLIWSKGYPREIIPCLFMLIFFSFSALAATPQVEGMVISPPDIFGENKIIFKEGTEERLSKADEALYLKLEMTIPGLLKNILLTIQNEKQLDAKDQSLMMIRDVVQQLQGNDTESLVRYILNRGMKIIEKIMDPHQDRLFPNGPEMLIGFLDLQHGKKRIPGTLDQEIRVLLKTVKLAEVYYSEDKKVLQGGDLKNQYDKFGMDYAKFLMEMTESVLNARVQYELAKAALGQFHADLARTQKTAYGDIIKNIHYYLKALDKREVPTAMTDSFCIAQIIGIRAQFARARDEFNNINKVNAEVQNQLGAAQSREDLKKAIELRKRAK